MGRPSKLGDRQRAEIGRRLANGEKATDLAKEFKVSKGLVSQLFSKQVPTIQKLATDLATVEHAIAERPVSEQASIRSLADQMKGMQADYLKGASTGLKTASILHDLAHKRASGLDHASADTEDLRVIAASLDTANKASSMGTSLLNANKDAAKETGQATLGSLLGVSKGGE